MLQPLEAADDKRRYSTPRTSGPRSRWPTRSSAAASRIPDGWSDGTSRSLNRARGQGPDAYASLLARLEELSAAKVADLQAPGQVLLKLAATGFGVRLPG